MISLLSFLNHTIIHFLSCPFCFTRILLYVLFKLPKNTIKSGLTNYLWATKRHNWKRPEHIFVPETKLKLSTRCWQEKDRCPRPWHPHQVRSWGRWTTVRLTKVRLTAIKNHHHACLLCLLAVETWRIQILTKDVMRYLIDFKMFFVTVS